MNAVKRWRRIIAPKREVIEQGITTIWVAAIATAVFAGGGGVAYVATDGFGAKSEEKPAAASAAAAESEPAEEPTTERTEDETSEAPVETTAPTQPEEEDPSGRVAKTDGDQGSAAEVNPEPSTLPQGLPKGFPNIGVPFYSPTKQMTSHGDGGELYVLEYVTDHELTIVNMFFDHRLVENAWQNISRNVEGQMTISEASSQGYSLVVAVGPERMDDSKTSIHYTLRKQ